jgi:hypothetical protein
MGLVQLAQEEAVACAEAPPVSWHLKVLPPPEVNWKEAIELLISLLGPAVMVTDGPSVSTVT